MVVKPTTVEQLLQTIRTASDPERAAALDALVEAVYVRLREYKDRHFPHRDTTGENISDVLQMAIKSFLSDVRHDRIPPQLSWDALAFGYFRKKILATMRRSASRSRVLRMAENSSLDRKPAPPPAEADGSEPAIEAVLSILPSGDGSATVFRELVVNGKTQKQVSESLGLSERSVGQKRAAILNHLVDALLAEVELNPPVREALHLVLDPRTRVPAVSQRQGKRLSEFERRIMAAAGAVGVEVSVMTRRVNQALEQLAEQLHERET